MVLSAILLAATLQSERRLGHEDLRPRLREAARPDAHRGAQLSDDAVRRRGARRTEGVAGEDRRTTSASTYRDAGLIDEIELPGPPNAPVLGLMVHGDVQPVDADAWSFPPFAGKADDDYVYGRGSADDKGPLVQALLAMKALKESGITRTHTVRLLVGSDEESNNTDVAEYLKTHQPPDYTLVLDSEFPVVVGEKAWNSLSLTTDAKSERARRREAVRRRRSSTRDWRRASFPIAPR